MKDKSWRKVEIDHLLFHEQGHYLIGCLCALEFQRKCREYKFSSNYKQEVDKIFKTNLSNLIKKLNSYLKKEK